MEENVKALVLQLGDIVRKQTKGYYPDVNEALKSLRDYVQETTASKSGLEDRLHELEDMLATKSEKKKPFVDQTEKIRKALRMQRKATARVTRTKEEKRKRPSSAPSERITHLSNKTKQTKTVRPMPVVKEEKYQQYEFADRKKLEEEVKSLRMRLSELAGAKLYKDNPNIVDLSDPNRPAKLKDKYCEIYSNEWMDAYQKLSESKSKRSEANKIKFLLDILLEGFAYCTQIRDIQRVGLLEVILYPMGDYGERQVKKENVEISDILARHLAEVPKLSGDMTGEQVAKAFFWKKDMREKFGPDFETNETYIIQCVKLCWLMQVQTPPVCIDLAAKPGDKFDNETYKEYTKKGKKIDFIVWPPLRRNEGGDLIEKGVAQGK